jgi:hypothetical protein
MLEELLEGMFYMQFMLRLYNESLWVSYWRQWVSCETVATQYGHEHGSRGISVVGSHYQVATSREVIVKCVDLQ